MADQGTNEDDFELTLTCFDHEVQMFVDIHASKKLASLTIDLTSRLEEAYVKDAVDKFQHVNADKTVELHFGDDIFVGQFLTVLVFELYRHRFTMSGPDDSLELPDALRTVADLMQFLADAKRKEGVKLCDEDSFSKTARELWEWFPESTMS